MEHPLMTTAPADIALHASEVLSQGYTILPDIIPKERLPPLREALDRIMAAEAALGTDPDANTADHQVSYVLAGKDPAFHPLPFHPTLQSLMLELLGTDFILSAFNGLNLKPQGAGQKLHMDQEDSTGALIVSVNALHVLDDFTTENGATRLVPGSHLENWPRRGYLSNEEARSVSITAPAGSVIAYSGGLLHAGSANRSDLPRRALHLYYCRNWILPHWDFRKSLPRTMSETLTAEEKRLFGFYHRADWYDSHAGKKMRGRIAHSPGSWGSRLRRWIRP